MPESTLRVTSGETDLLVPRDKELAVSTNVFVGEGLESDSLQNEQTRARLVKVGITGTKEANEAGRKHKRSNKG